jgi:hypothetical protein
LLNRHGKIEVLDAGAPHAGCHKFFGSNDQYDIEYTAVTDAQARLMDLMGTGELERIAERRAQLVDASKELHLALIGLEKLTVPPTN